MNFTAWSPYRWSIGEFGQTRAAARGPLPERRIGGAAKGPKRRLEIGKIMNDIMTDVHKLEKWGEKKS